MAFPNKNNNYDEMSYMSRIEDASTNKIFLPTKNLKHPNKFTVPQETLVTIVGACQERTFAEEIDMLETYGSFHLMFLLNRLIFS